MPDVVMVIAPEVFRDEEYSVPKRVLEERGASVTTASTRPGECIGKLGMRATADISITEALDHTWDAVAFVGGAGASVLFDDPMAHRLARQEYDRGAVVAAICIAPSILAHAGLLTGRRATAFASQRDDLIEHGAAWSDGPVVVDDTIVTASGPEAAADFGNSIGELMGLHGDALDISEARVAHHERGSDQA